MLPRSDCSFSDQVLNCLQILDPLLYAKTTFQILGYLHLFWSPNILVALKECKLHSTAEWLIVSVLFLNVIITHSGIAMKIQLNKNVQAKNPC